MVYEITPSLVPAGTGIRCKKSYPRLIPEGMCWHWTANLKATANAINHFKLWHRVDTGAQYVVDDKNILQCALDTEVVWHAGPGSSYTPEIKKKYPRGPNVSLLGVELCVNSDGNWDETYKRAVYLGAYKCLQYGWSPYNDFVRHYDCTKKDCPRMMSPYVTGGDATWKRFLDDVNNQMTILKKGDAIMAELAQWQKDLANTAIDYLAQKGTLDSPENWKKKMAEATPNWLFYEMLKRLSLRIDKLEQTAGKQN